MFEEVKINSFIEMIVYTTVNKFGAGKRPQWVENLMLTCKNVSYKWSSKNPPLFPKSTRDVAFRNGTLFCSSTHTCHRPLSATQTESIGWFSILWNRTIMHRWHWIVDHHWSYSKNQLVCDLFAVHKRDIEWNCIDTFAHILYEKDNGIQLMFVGQIHTDHGPIIDALQDMLQKREPSYLRYVWVMNMSLTMVYLVWNNRIQYVIGCRFSEFGVDMNEIKWIVNLWWKQNEMSYTNRRI